LDLGFGLSKSLQKNEIIQRDSDERWFNNPQFRLKVTKTTNLYISLMQFDEKTSKLPYIKVAFMVINNKAKKHRVWERPLSADIVCESSSDVGIRELTCNVTLKKEENKPYTYFVIMSASTISFSKPFFLDPIPMKPSLRKGLSF